MKKIRGLRYYIIALITAGTVLNYLARSSLSVAAPTLTHVLQVSTAQYSYVVAAFQAAYTVAQPIAGWILDHIGLRIGFALFAVAWAAANMLHALATNWQGLAVFRGLLGFSEAAIFPAGLKAISAWFPKSERSVAAGWISFGAGFGSMLAPPIMVYCILNYGWQVGFAVTGGIALVWVAAWLLFYREPERHPRMAERELAVLRSEHAASGAAASGAAARPSFRSVIRQRNFWGIAAARFLTEPAWQTFSFWIPLYLVQVRHLDLKAIAAFAWLPFLAADLGAVVGGYLASMVYRFTPVSLGASRKIVLTFGCLLMIGPGSIGLVSNAYVAILLFCFGAFAHQCLSTCLYSLTVDSFDGKDVGTATGGAGMFGYGGGTLFSLLVGYLASKVGFNPLFACLAVFDLTAAAIIWIVVRPRSDEPLERDTHATADRLERAAR
ncbi:MFS transporter [Paraburkholderia acidisoli]|uniref:MFS transporter n=1 Tax=Paraburkholderia acidisoli TaxID=2571748 RepID=A0A7Z2JIF9_9BURK|nr:MFS transporter [Paraburkholderia acidisoli]QGZ64280.1 MFS transporter [Paraburkholderia acidisoli]